MTHALSHVISSIKVGPTYKVEFGDVQIPINSFSRPTIHGHSMFQEHPFYCSAEVYISTFRSDGSGAMRKSYTGRFGSMEEMKVAEDYLQEIWRLAADKI